MVDLHTHRIYSDVNILPEEVVEKAYNNGVRWLALTDHDTLQGIPDFLKAGKKYFDLHCIIGCETSSRFREKEEIHVLALKIEEPLKLSKYVKQMADVRFFGVMERIKLLQQHGYKINPDDVLKENVGVITNQDVTRFLIKNNIINNKDEIKGWAKKDGIAYYNIYNLFPDVKDTIDAINNSQAISVLAHPYKLNFNDKDLENYIKTLVEYGLQGIECYHSNHTILQTELYLNIAKKFNLIVTGGSDHHGKPEQTHKKFGMSNLLQQKIPENIANFLQ
jgi:predicted metal-dependent phosphoesterase TrpH